MILFAYAWDKRICVRRGTLLEFSLFGAWRSLVARFNGVEEVVGSNPAAPTDGERRECRGVLCIR